METNLDRMACGQCGELKHILYIDQDKNLHIECSRCGNVSKVTVTTPEIKIRNEVGIGVICKESGEE